MRFSFLLSALLSAAVLVSGTKVVFSDCGGSIYTVKDIEASSWPPIPGTSGVNLNSTVVLTQDINAGTKATYKQVSKFSGIDVDSKSGSLCDGSFGDLKCPVKAGTFVVNSATGDVPQPPFGLKGEVTTVVQIYIDDQLAGCSSTKFKV